MDFVAVVDQVMTLLRQRGRVTYRLLKRQFTLDDESLGVSLIGFQIVNICRRCLEIALGSAPNVTKNEI